MSSGFPKLDLPIQPPYPPMEAKRVDAVPSGDKWLFEPKWDGFRAIIFRSGDEVAIQSKAGQPLTRYFPEVVEAIRSLKAKQFILDGEIVVPVDGRLSFDDLLLRIHPAESRVRKLAESSPANYYAFDLLCARGRSLTVLPIEERRARLEKFFDAAGRSELLRLSPRRGASRRRCNIFLGINSSSPAASLRSNSLTARTSSASSCASTSRK